MVDNFNVNSKQKEARRIYLRQYLSANTSAQVVAKTNLNAIACNTPNRIITSLLSCAIKWNGSNYQDEVRLQTWLPVGDEPINHQHDADEAELLSTAKTLLDTGLRLLAASKS